jgi:hypothetical protein
MNFNTNDSVVEKTLLQIKTIEEAISENAKGILASTMKEEISELVRESLKTPKKKNVREQGEDADAAQPQVDDEVEGTEIDVDTEMSPEGDETEVSTEMGVEVPTDNVEMPPLDMSKAPMKDVMKVFKAMGDEDGIIVVKDGENIHLTDTNADTEYMINMGGGSDEIDATYMDTTNESVVYELVYEQDEMGESYDDMMEMDDEDLDESYDDMMEMDDEDLDESYDDMMEMDDETMYEIQYDEENEDMDPMMEERMKPVGIGFGKRRDGMSKSSVNNKGFKDSNKGGLKSEKRGKGPKFSFGKIKHGVTESEMDEMDEYTEGWMDETNMMDSEMTEMDYMEMDSEFGGNKHDYKRRGGHKIGDVGGHYKDYEMMEMDDEMMEMDDEMYEGNDSQSFEMPGETTEASRTLTYRRRAERDRVAAPSQLRKESFNKELNLLREKNEEYKKALDFFRNKLNEVAIFNSNLAYSTRLFTEHSTTKQEKINILRRFDNVESLKESKSLYKSIKSELEGTSKSNKVVKESVESKITKTASTGSATNLIENKTYENPQFMRMKDLMLKIK